jgi:RimJ/RimL family protein N-acetyltransferase
MSEWTIISNPARVFGFVQQYVPIYATGGMQGIGLEKDGELVAGVLYEGFNGVNTWMHVGATPGKRWMTKDFLRAAFRYPFVQLGCQRVSGYVEAHNMAARKFDEHLGFEQEAVLKGAASDGGDVILYVMPREQCRYV